MAGLSTFIIAGGTGRQGGAAINALLNDPISPVQPNKIYAITRNANSAASRSLASKGIQLIQGDLTDSTAIFDYARTHGAKPAQTGAYLAQAHGPQEVLQAKAFIDAAVSLGIAYLVYSSVDRGGPALSDRDPSFCKTFSDKYLIEKHLIAASSKTPSLSYTILRPTWFADNALWGFPGRLCMTGWRDTLHGQRMQITCVADIGRWAATALLRPDTPKVRNQAISVASDELSFAEADAIFREETGGKECIPVANAWLTWLVIWLVKDLRTMFAWIGQRPYGAEIEWLARYVEPTSFRDWVRENAVARKTD